MSLFDTLVTLINQYNAQVVSVSGSEMIKLNVEIHEANSQLELIHKGNVLSIWKGKKFADCKDKLAMDAIMYMAKYGINKIDL